MTTLASKPTRRARARRSLLLGGVALAYGCAAGNAGTGEFTTSSGSAPGGSGPVCAQGTTICEGTVAKVCDGNGGFESETPCSSGYCSGDLGCIPCLPGPGTCENGIGKSCNADKTGLIEFACDPVQGMECTPEGCIGECTPQMLGSTYLGCEYWPTVTMNSVWADSFSFAVAVSSTVGFNTKVVVEGPNFNYNFQLLPYEARTLDLPWVQPLKGPDSDAMGSSVKPTANNKGGAYRVRSDHPIAAYQFNPLEYENAANPPSCPNLIFNKCYSYSNDASLLLPTNALTGSYYVVGYRTVFQSDFMVITATQDDTQVTIKAGPKTRTLAGEGVELKSTGATATVTMQRGEALQLFTQGTLQSQQWAGSTVTANHPIQIITGSPCATIPNANVACDHLEEVVLPAETLGNEYAVAVPRTPLGVVGTPNGGRHMVRIHGITNDTMLSFDPPSISTKTSIDAAGVIEIAGVTEDFVVFASEPFAVTQYLYGQGDATVPGDVGVGAGDPSQSIAIPTAQYRSNYTFVAPTSFEKSYVNIVAPKGLSVEIDGAVLQPADFKPIGGTEWAAARHELKKQPFHRATANEPFGIVVYAYGQYTSYMYPGGMDLKKISQPVPD